MHRFSMALLGLHQPLLGHTTQRSRQSAANEHILKARLEELLKLLGQYCEAVALYRENVTQYFDAKIHQDRAARILDS